MKLESYQYNCRVCGLKFLDPPWGEDNNTPDFTHCPCCGVMFGYGDATIDAVQRWRESWLSNGALWDTPKQKPNDWDLETQLLQIPPDFR